jgi:magnesium-transporting ATPase (P-type)
MLVSVYFMLQVLPLCLIGWFGVRFKHNVLKHSSPDGKRKAILQRRGLFDFVSPVVVFIAVSSYFLFVAFLIYIQQHPFPGFAGLATIGGVTLVYAVNAFGVYKMLYGKKINPIETHAGHLHTMSLTVKSCVYSCIACVAFISLNFTLVLLDLQRWEPFALSVFFVTTALLCSMVFTARPRRPEAEGLGSGLGTAT